MDIVTCQRGAHATVDLIGRWAIGAADSRPGALQCLIVRLVEGGCVDVTLNLRRLATLDAHALGEIATLSQELRTAGGSLTLAAPNRFVRQMIAVTRLDTMIPVHDTPALPAPATAIRCAPSPAQVGRAPG